MINNKSPVCYFDFTTGSGTSLEDSAPLFFANPRGVGNPQTARANIAESATSVSTAAGWGATGYTFNAANLNAFYVLSGDAGYGDYAELFEGAECLLFWANFRVDNDSGTTGQNTILACQADSGKLISFEYSDGSASEQRLRTRTSRGGAAVTVANDSGSIKNTTDFFNVAVFIDTRTGQGNIYSTHSGSMNSSNSILTGPFSFTGASADQGIVVGCTKTSTTPSAYFRGTIARMGLMNLGPNPPYNMANIMQGLFWSDGEPTTVLEGA